MSGSAYYNEIDPFAAQWLRNLIAAGHIAPGDVDERSIVDVSPDDLRGYTQCHFFAGIGVWSYALRLAEWDDARPVWTGSCPCQPFSAAGKQRGHDDERHLWPAWFRLIRECRPDLIFGEQVAGAIRHGWLDLVQSDLEGEGYACGAVVFGAHGVGAPHIRQRLWWVAQSEGEQHDGRGDTRGWRGQPANGELVGDTDDARSQGWQLHAECARECAAPSPSLAGFWSDADWIACRDGKARPVEPGTFPLAHGAAARVGRLRAYGNAVVAQAARALIEAYAGAAA